MTFFKINDPKNRELIKEVIAKRSIIREADRRRKMGEAFEFEQLSRFFKPITKQTEKMEEKIEKGFKGLPGEIAKVLPRPINIQQPMGEPPAYEPPFAGEAEIPEQEEKPEELPPYVNETDEGKYRIGEYEFDFDDTTKEIKQSDGEVLTKSPNVYDILTNKNTDKKWEDLNEEEQNILGIILVKSKTIYSNYKKEKPTANYKLKRLSKQWRNLYSHIWYNRFTYMRPNTEEGKKMLEKEKEEATNYLTHKDKRITNTTKKVIKYYLNLEGKGISKAEDRKINSKAEDSKADKKIKSKADKNYVTLPSDPTELVDRLTLLAGSKDAGNTSVYNEMVSICDELLKKKIIGKGQYKKFLSTIN